MTDMLYSIVEHLEQLQSLCLNDKKAAYSTNLVHFATVSRTFIQELL